MKIFFIKLCILQSELWILTTKIFFDTQNRYLDSFMRLTLLPHSFPRDEERSILAFCKGQDLIREATDAGATTAGGTDLVKKIQVFYS